jgi:hypothetical protein
MGADVATVVIAGKIVVENHQPRTIDVEGLYREVRTFCAQGLTPEQRAHADFLKKIKPYVQAWYATWHETMLDQPFFRSRWSRSWACRAAIGRIRSSWRPPYRRRRPNMKP